MTNEDQQKVDAIIDELVSRCVTIERERCAVLAEEFWAGSPSATGNRLEIGHDIAEVIRKEYEDD